jgi:hypothetical protein
MQYIKVLAMCLLVCLLTCTKYTKSHFDILSICFNCRPCVFVFPIILKSQFLRV